MSLPPQLVQFLGSLAAIFVLAAIALALKLGPARTIGDETAARAAAREADDGFEPVAVATDGAAALARDAAGRVMVLKRHGSHFAARMLGPGASARSEDGALVVETGERRFGAVRLMIEDASDWVQAIAARTPA